MSVRHLIVSGLACLALGSVTLVTAQTTTTPSETLTQIVPVGPAAPVLPQREFIIVSGGPAMRTFERDKASSHDKSWENFIMAALARFKQLEPQMQAGEKITWLVYRPSYVERGAEMVDDLVSDVTEKANKAGVNLFWFDRPIQLINYLNHGKDRKTTPIALFEYFGHSNKACFLFDYSNEIDGMSTAFLHVNDLAKIDRTIFAPDAQAKSWGCHSGELYSGAWKTHFGIPMVGAIGKTDYSHGGLPFLSSDGGHWAQ